MNQTSPEIFVFTPPVTTNGGVTTDYISLKNVHKLRVTFIFTQAQAHATGVDPVQATTVAGGSAKAITSTLPIWYNVDISLGSALTRGTDAITQNCAATAKNQVIVFDIDPAGLDVANGFDCLAFTVDDSSQATNFVTAVAEIWPRYPGLSHIA